FVQLFPNGGDETAPLVVGLHGRGDTPEGFSRVFSDFPLRAEVVVPRAHLPFHLGFEWFDWPQGITDEELARRIGEAEDKLWPSLATHAHGRKLIIVGFSQGAILAFTLAARHPDDLLAAFPISGAFPRPLWPTGRSAPVHALHGTADPLLPVWMSRE